MGETDVEVRTGDETLANIESELQGGAIFTEGTLAHLRGEYGEGENKHLSRAERVNSILGYLRAVRDDAPKGDKSNFPPMLDATSKLLDYKHDGAADTSLNPVRGYIEKQRDIWKEQAQQAQRDDRKEDLEIAETNILIFNSFLQTLNEGPQAKEQTTEDATSENLETGQDSASAQGEFPEFVFKPHDADELLGKMDDKKADFKLLQEYLTAARKDIAAQRQAVKTANPILFDAYTAAKEFSDSNPGNSENIVVIIEDGKVAYSGSAQNAPKNKSGQRFLFTNDDDDSNAYNLNQYRQRFDTYELRIADIEHGLEVTERLDQSRKAVIDDNREGDADRLSITRILDLHTAHLDSLGNNNLSADKKSNLDKKYAALEKFSVLVEKRTPEGSKGGIQKFITKAGNKLRRSRSSGE